MHQVVEMLEKLAEKVKRENMLCGKQIETTPEDENVGIAYKEYFS